MRRYCIINLKRLREARMSDSGSIDCEILEKEDGPTCFYTSKVDAELELIRLETKHPGNNFQIFESCASIRDHGPYKGDPAGAKRVFSIEPTEKELADRCMSDHNCPTYGICPECGHEAPEDEHFD